MSAPHDAALAARDPAAFCAAALADAGACWHLVGAGGIGVSAVARLLLGGGHKVRGSDVRASQLTDALNAEGADVRIGHSAEHLDGVDVLVVSTAIPEGNPELVAARARDLPIVHRSHLLAALLERAQVAVGVTGTHGKGTVSSAVVHALWGAGRDPGFAIGGLLLDHGTNARCGATGLLVAELDESDGTVVNSHPTHAILNNLELDHLNYYEDWDQLAETMRRFATGNRRLQRFVANAADPGVARLLPSLREAGVPLRTYGVDAADADLVGRDLRTVALDGGRVGGTMEVYGDGRHLGTLRTKLPGAYNLSNLLGAVTMAMELGVSFNEAAAALAGFSGLENRFTVVDTGRRLVVKDYISHPTGIRRVLAGAEHFARRPIVAVFKPYRFTMINYLQDDYRDAFRTADHVLVTELYTAGEVPIPGIDTEFLCGKIREGGPAVTFVPEMEALGDHLRAHHGDAGMVIFFGGDDLFGVADRYAAADA